MPETTSQWLSVVRWAETDAAGIVYHARLFDWFSEARAVWLREHGLDYYQVMRSRGIELLVSRAAAEFYRTLKPGDAVRVEVFLERCSPTRAQFGYRVLYQNGTGRALAAGSTEHAFVVAGRAQRLDRGAADILLRFAEGVRPEPEGRRPRARSRI